MRGPYLLQTCGKWEQNGCQSKYIHRKTGLGAHTQRTHTHRLSKKSLYPDFTLFNTDFGFVDFKHRHSFTSQPWICLFLSMSILFPFLIIRSMPSLNVIVQEWGKNQTLQMNRAGQGMLVSAACFLHSDYSHQSSTGYLRPNCSNKDLVVLLEGSSGSSTPSRGHSDSLHRLRLVTRLTRGGGMKTTDNQGNFHPSG